jgi:hypothetical protein
MKFRSCTVYLQGDIQLIFYLLLFVLKSSKHHYTIPPHTTQIYNATATINPNAVATHRAPENPAELALGPVYVTLGVRLVVTVPFPSLVESPNTVLVPVEPPTSLEKVAYCSSCSNKPRKSEEEWHYSGAS